MSRLQQVCESRTEDEPEVEVVQCEDTGDGKAILTLTVILNKVCAECGTALKIGQTDVDVGNNTQRHRIPGGLLMPEAKCPKCGKHCVWMGLICR
jgi:hypothetical protein